MKQFLRVALSIAMLGMTGTVLAQKASSEPWNLEATAATGQHVPVLPAPGELRDLERWLYKADNYSVPPAANSSRPHPGERMGVLGLMSRRYFQGSVTLYGCDAWGSQNRFTSLDFRCEGQQPNERNHTLGFIAATQLPDTVPLYRCHRINPGNWLDHFDTTDAQCEGAPGAVNEGVLGYIWH